MGTRRHEATQRGCRASLLLATLAVTACVRIGFELGPATTEPPRPAWALQFGGPTADGANGVAVDPAGNVYLAGRFSSTANFGASAIVAAADDVFLASFDSDGKHRFSFGAGGPETDRGEDVAFGGGRVVITGGFSGSAKLGGATLISAGQADGFVAEYDASGAPTHSRRFGGTNTDTGLRVAVDDRGAIVVTGRFTASANFGTETLVSAGKEDIFVAAYESDGTLRFAKRFGGPDNDAGQDVALDRNRNIYVTGYFAGSVDFGGDTLVSAGADGFVASFDPDGKRRFSRRFGGVFADRGQAIAVDGAGASYVVGSFRETADFGMTSLDAVEGDDGFLACYEADGLPRFAIAFGGASVDLPTGVALDAEGHIYVVGNFQAEIDFGSEASRSAGSTHSLSSLGATDIFVASFDRSGRYRFALRFGDIRAQRAHGVAIASDGSIYIAGDFLGIVDFGSSTLTARELDIFLVKLAPR